MIIFAITFEALAAASALAVSYAAWGAHVGDLGIVAVGLSIGFVSVASAVAEVILAGLISMVHWVIAS